MRQLLDIMRRLRDPEGGCPWDIEQDFASIAPYTIEEAYEVADAIARGDMADLRDELGDLLFQVVYHAQMASEQGFFDFEQVHGAVCEKMIRRHPHVFADLEVRDAAQQKKLWEDHKARERGGKGDHSLMDGVAAGMGELRRAVKLQARAARVGFDWAEAGPVLRKFSEELAEMSAAMAAGDRDAMEDELGDLLFVATNLARKLGLDPGAALRRSNAKFERRFRAMEALAGGQQGLRDMGPAGMEDLWEEVKTAAGPDGAALRTNGEGLADDD